MKSKVLNIIIIITAVIAIVINTIDKYKWIGIACIILMCMVALMKKSS